VRFSPAYAGLAPSTCGSLLRGASVNLPPGRVAGNRVRAILALAMTRSKATLKAELLDQLEAALQAARSAHAAAAAGAIDDEARPENDKDTRGLEQSYLARGHAQRVAELEAAITTITAFAPRAFRQDDAIAIGALISLAEEARTRELWLVPCGGGLVLADTTTLVTPVSPLGKSLLGRRLDDEVELTHGGTKRMLTIIGIS
jgi:transcription elongation GreA/GreB family factor